MVFSKKARKASIRALAAAGLIFACSSAPIWSQGTEHIIHKIRPAAAAQLPSVGRMPGSQRLSVAVGLPLRNESELADLLGQLYDPASPQYRQWRTPEQLAEQFGATEQDCQAVRDWAQAHHLTVKATHPNRLIVDVEGAVADLESAFNVVLRTYNHPTENRTFFAPDTEPSVDLPVQLLSVCGLDNYSLPHPQHRIKPSDSGSPITPHSGSGPSGQYMGGDFRAAYVPGTSLDGSGQTIGLLQFDGFYSSDITAYESQAGLPNVPLTVVPIDGGVSTPGSGNSEVCLDIEMVISMAPGIGRVYVYEAPNPSPFLDILSRMQTDNLSKQLSCSWGGGGTDASSENIFKLMSAQGQSFFNATGDSDAFTSSISFPSDSTNITQVGGTTLTTTGPLGSYVSEKVWNWGLNQGSYVGSSGGVSTYYKIPNYQVPVSMALNQGSTTMRNVPDVALTGDNVYVRYNNGSSGTFGGTSCAAPLWAGVTALINQQRAASGQNSVGFMNPPLYTIGLGPNYNTDFHDITVGDNTWPSSPTKYYATNGYDLCTGWGTPTINLINALAGPPAPSLASNSVAITAESCANGAVDPNETVTINFGLKNVGGAPTTNLVATLLASGGVTSPSGPRTYGAMASGASVVQPFTFTANGSCGGSVTATLSLQDGSASLGSVAFVFPLGAPTPGTPLNENFDGVTAPALPAGWSSSAISGTQTSWATSTGASSSSPNAAFIADTPSTSENALVSPVISIISSSAQLTFSQNYNLEFLTRHGSTAYYDGGVLEIKIGNGPFTDIISAGGSFVSGGYNATLASGGSNPLNGRQAWGGNSGGWITTTVVLPAAAGGQTVQLRWACGTDVNNSSGGVGWYVDSVSVSDMVLVCCSTGSSNTVPAFSLQPTGRVAVAGQNVTFNAGANGSPVPAYQWYFNGTNQMGGKTSSTLTLSNVQPSQAGGYSVTASNVVGSVTSLVAQLTVLVPPSVTTQPTNFTVVSGGNAAFYVAASGSAPLSYQWQLANTNLSGATATALQLSNVQPSQAGNYRVVITNSAGAVTSSVASLTVLVPPGITAQPTNVTATVGSNATFSVAATGTAPLTYQWQLASTNLPGATATTLQLANVQTSQAGNYRAIVSNAAGSATSSVATLTVLVPPSITSTPTNLTVISGSNATFSVAASGTAPLTYQWQLASTNLPGATATSLQLANVQTSQAGNYRAIVSNAAGSATSSVATLTVLVPPSITSPPTNLTVISGSNATFSVAASGTVPLTYQWQLAGTNLPGATATSLQLANVQTSQAGNYRAIVSNAAGSATSSVATLTVLVPPSITLQPSNVTVVPGGNAVFSGAASGSLPLAYQWQFGQTNLAGDNASVVQLINVQPAQAGNYVLVVTNLGGAITSAPADLRVLVTADAGSINVTGSIASITVTSVVGLIYTLESKDHLTDPTWIPIPPSSTGTGGILILQDTNAFVPSRLYRVRTE
jgi:hypothetical protein